MFKKLYAPPSRFLFISSRKIRVNSFLLLLIIFNYCKPPAPSGPWDYSILFEQGESLGVMKLQQTRDVTELVLESLDWGKIILHNAVINKEEIYSEFDLYGQRALIKGNFTGNSFSGTIRIDDKTFPFRATQQSNSAVHIDRSQLSYTLAETDLPAYERNIDHAGILASNDLESLKSGERIYNTNCINCHGNKEVEGSIPLATKFWEAPFKAGNDAYSMYLTISRGFANMPPQPVLSPQEKYDVIYYIQQQFIRINPEETLIHNSPAYLAQLPRGTSRGPAIKPYQPWADMDYGDFLINTYELVDEQTGPARYHSPRPVPYPDENYLENNFAYKGIAVRLDKGKGGISKGKAWMLFDHDLMRVAGGWTGDGFIDWNGILLNDQHETYPRTIGKLHFETPVSPGWANPTTGTFKDPRFVARDGRAFGPLPKTWARYKGLYHHDGHIIIAYTIGKSNVLEELGMEKKDTDIIFTRTLNISPSSSVLKMKIASDNTQVAITGDGAQLIKEDGYIMMLVNKQTAAKVKVFITDAEQAVLNELKSVSAAPADLTSFTTAGGTPHYPDIIKSTITAGTAHDVFAVDQLTPPFDNPWACRMKLSGIDFLNDPNKAVVCTTDGDVWLITGLIDDTGQLQWQRIGSGLFQPLGIKVLDDKIYVICRDQLVLLHDFNGDMETDFYESFNNDHQVTDHFHEFAMGLQADEEGNFYYAKSGRHAREALVPQHGTLLKVSYDGSKTDIIARGFRAANGVCINPDGSFLVTDQQGFWNPMNRINWVQGMGKFYGNIWGYDPPKDTTRLAMEPPMVWVDMNFDRSPSELLWVDSKKWGPLNGGLLSFSYGFGKIQLVLHEKINGQMQGGVIDLPNIKFLTGVMRGRFNPGDEQLYACGMSAWGTNQMLRGGGLYRIRYTGKPLPTPVALNVSTSGLTLRFATALDPPLAKNLNSYKIESWELRRSSAYGSDRHNRKILEITDVVLGEDGKTIKLNVSNLQRVDVMTIDYELQDISGNLMQGTVQNTIHKLQEDNN